MSMLLLAMLQTGFGVIKYAIEGGKKRRSLSGRSFNF